MRAGAPDSLDLMVAISYANLAIDQLMRGHQRPHGRAAERARTPQCRSRRTMQGLKRVDVDELYDAEQYRPKVRHVLGKPMFLY